MIRCDIPAHGVLRRRFATVLQSRSVVCVYLLLCVSVCAALSITPLKAFAYFNDVTDSYPASQDIPISGDVLTGADIPEGTYSITATASSYMCKFTNVTLTSAGGELWATFTLSKAYNALYFGTAEEAAAATNEDGTDYSAYYVSEPLEGYVARQFSLPIPALNYEITLATFSGGSKGIDKGMWYTRTLVFNSSSEVMNAIENAKNPQPEVNPGKEDNSEGSGGGNQSDDGSKDNGGNAAASSDADESGSDDDADDSDSGDSASKSSSSKSNGTKSSAGTTANSGNRAESQGGNNGGVNDDSANAEKPEKDAKPAESEAKKQAAAKNGKLGHAISFVELDELPLGDAPTQIALVDVQEQERNEEAAVAAVVGIVLVNLVLIGAFLVMIRRVRPRRFPRV